MRSIHLPTKKNETQRSDEQLLRLQDGSEVLETQSFDELIVQLRERHPDEGYERFLRRERDQQAEQQHKSAMNRLARIIAKAVVNTFLNSDGAAGPAG